MINHKNVSDILLRRQIHHGEINYGGNRKLKIYGTLHCGSGKRMKKENRVFFKSTQEAISYGYRPCGHCMKPEYHLYKQKLQSNQ